jgi:Glucose / Sorbosone dehydrogenase
MVRGPATLQTICFVLSVLSPRPSAAQAQELTLELKDYVTMPMTGVTEGKGTNEVLLARVNALREEPGGANRLFIADLNGPLYILDKTAKTFTTYLDFDGREGHSGIFPRFFVASGYGNGLNGFYFDPDYRRNGKFYTVHMEDPSLTISNAPVAKRFPGLNLAGYTTTAAVKTPNTILNEGVLIEWTDTNPSNNTFEGTARELLRVQLNTRSHPMGDLIFNPAAKPGDPDWRVIYQEVGDGAAGESRVAAMRANPQRLDTLVGKILRIIPDLNEHVSTSIVSENGRYRIPNDNPFVGTAGARKEIWAYGFRNPHRLSWAIDPDNSANDRLIANSVGLHTWETVNIVHKGGNYGYSQREGNETLKPDNTTGPLPAVDRIPVQIADEVTDKVVVPIYPVMEYGHVPTGGDAIGSGFVYSGRNLPALRGKYIFTDITTGRIWWADYKEMLAADDGKPDTMAKFHEVKIRWDNPADSPDAGTLVFNTMFPINEATYHARGGKEEHLASRQTVANQGRADDRFAVDASGELYLYSKSDGMIRQVVGATVAGK